jgi:hypothetical protein
VDAVASAILDLVLSTEEPPKLLNVVHPHAVTWRETFDAINSALGQNLPFVPYTDWVEQVKARSIDASQQTLETIVRSPAARNHMRAFGSDDVHIACNQALGLFQRSDTKHVGGPGDGTSGLPRSAAP